MAGESFASRKYDRLTERELVDGFGKLVTNEWRVAEAKPFIRRMKSVPSISAPYLIEAMVRGGRPERETATSLLRLLAGPRVIVPLRDVMKSADAPDEARVAAAMVLEDMGEPVNVEGLIAELTDPKGMFDSVWETIIDRAGGDEAFLENLLKSMLESPAAEREELIRSLAEPGDPRIFRVLRPLLFSNRVGTIVASIDAIEAIGGTAALPSLQEIADGDPSPQVRQRARAAYGRLHMRTQSFFPDGDPMDSARSVLRLLPLHRCWVTLLDGRGHQAVLVAYRRPEGSLKVVSTMLSDTEGMRSCVGIETMKVEELADIEAQLLPEGLQPVEVDIELCLALLEEARRKNLDQRRRLPMEYEIWKSLFPAAPPKGAASLPDGIYAEGEPALLSLLPQTESLMARSEFRQWVFDPSLVWPYVDEWSYTPAHQQTGKAGRQTLDRLVGLAAADLIDEEHRRVLSKRLYRQAWLLERLGDDDTPRLARAASLGLDPARGVPLELHPFVRAMLMASFFNAGLRLRQPGLTGIGWLAPAGE